jgi:hypothetical protein
MGKIRWTGGVSNMPTQGYISRKYAPLKRSRRTGDGSLVRGGVIRGEVFL